MNGSCASRMTGSLLGILGERARAGRRRRASSRAAAMRHLVGEAGEPECLAVLRKRNRVVLQQGDVALAATRCGSPGRPARHPGRGHATSRDCRGSQSGRAALEQCPSASPQFGRHHRTADETMAGIEVAKDHDQVRLEGVDLQSDAMDPFGRSSRARRRGCPRSRRCGDASVRPRFRG